MNAGKPTTLEAIIKAMVERITDQTPIAREYIIPTLSEDWFDPGGLSDVFVLISDFSGVQNSPMMTGGGNEAFEWDASCKVTLFSRLDIDSPGADTQRLVNESYGLLGTWRKIQKALNQWLPDDGELVPQAILAAPARCVGYSVNQRQFRNSHGWCAISTTVRFPFIQDMT